MRLTKEDREIISLFKDKNLISLIEMHKALDRPKPNILRNLNKLVNNRILQKISDYPSYYSIKVKKEYTKEHFLPVCCPRCKTKDVIHENQKTVLCKACKEEGIRNPRFNVTKARVKEAYKMHFTEEEMKKYDKKEGYENGEGYYKQKDYPHIDNFVTY